MESAIEILEAQYEEAESVKAETARLSNDEKIPEEEQKQNLE